MDEFLIGDAIYLRKPDLVKDIDEGNWHEWFNDQKITKFLIHGIFPLDRNDQREIIEKELRNPLTLLLSIIERSSNKMIGVVSLKNINYLNRTAEIGIVMGTSEVSGAALEAMALVTQHAFDRMNLNKLFAGQHEGLWKWVNILMSIGFKIEGLRLEMGFRNGVPYNVILTGITAKDFYSITKARGDRILPTSTELRNFRQIENPIPRIKEFYDLINFLS